MSNAGFGGEGTFIPIKQRKVWCVGNLTYDEAKGHVEAVEKELTRNNVKDVVEVHGVGTYCDRVKVRFTNNQAMWAGLKTMKGKKLLIPDRLA